MVWLAALVFGIVLLVLDCLCLVFYQSVTFNLVASKILGLTAPLQGNFNPGYLLIPLVGHIVLVGVETITSYYIQKKQSIDGCKR